MAKLPKHSPKAVLLIIAVLAFVFMSSTSPDRKNFEIAKNLDIFIDLFGELIHNYVDEIDPGEIIYIGINSMLNSLDPYNQFVPYTETDELRFMTIGQYGGLGIGVLQKDGYVYISDIYENYPGDKAGLQVGDRIVGIDNKPLLGLPFREISLMLRGQPGTQVGLTIRRYGAERDSTINLKREIITINNIPYYGLLEGSRIGYIALTGFTENASREVREAVKNLKRQHQIEALIIDLRGNSGGLVSQAINILNLFVEKDKIVLTTKGKNPEHNQTHRTLNRPLDLEIPLAFLVDEESASASEVLAGAIQDLDRGVIIGQRTFGKGLMQKIIPLTYNTALRLTVARYYIPSGRSIQSIDHSKETNKPGIDRVLNNKPDTFTTANGRIVLGSGGITPDIITEPIKLSDITQTLITEHLLFEFANSFFSKNPAIPFPDNFIITDSIYYDFVRFLEGRDYSYLTESEMLLYRLNQIATEEKQSEVLMGKIRQMKDIITQQKENDLFTYRDQISLMLRGEIVNRYFKQRGRIISYLKDDPDIALARQILENPLKYNQLLSPGMEAANF